MLSHLQVDLIIFLSLGFSVFYGSFQGQEEEQGQNDDVDMYKRSRTFIIHPQTQHQVDFLENLMLTRSELDFLAEPRRSRDVVTFTAPEGSHVDIRQKLKAVGISFEESIQDTEDELRPAIESLVRRNSEEYAFNLDVFNSLEDINAYLEHLKSNCPQDIHCHLYSIGKSYEGRDIFVFKINKLTNRNFTDRKGFWIDATIHAREWLTTTTALKILNHLVYHTDSRAQRLVDNYDWYIAPLLNPDGFVFTFKQRRWRKNRNRFSSRNCTGVDLNRNFNFRWGTEGVSHDPCSPIYCGPREGSEPEVQAVQNESLRLGPSLLGWVTLHAYGNMWIFPYGNSVNYEGKICQRTDDYDDLMEVADAAANAVEETYGTIWNRGTTCEVVYVNSGSSLEYVKDVAGVKYSYGIELRGNDFNVTTTQIHPSFVEIWNGLVAMCDAIAVQINRSSAPRGPGRLDKGAILASLFIRFIGSRTGSADV